MIRVFIVAASPVARAGLENLLSARGLEVVGSTAGLEFLADRVSDIRTDVVLIESSGGQSESMFESIVSSELASEINVVVLTNRHPHGWPAEALRAGIRAVLPVDVSTDQLLAALQAAGNGLIVMHPAELDEIVPAAVPASRSEGELSEPLTRRELEVLQMLASGMGNKRIAAALNISEHTVKFHVASILGKLGAESRTEAVSLGIRRGLILI